MENVFDIKYKQQLEYILPDTVASDMDLQNMAFRNDTVVIMYFYYIDTLADYWKYIDNIWYRFNESGALQVRKGMCDNSFGRN